MALEDKELAKTYQSKITNEIDLQRVSTRRLSLEKLEHCNQGYLTATSSC